jgi:hypothetical protein
MKDANNAGRADTLDRIKSCMVLESACSEVYHLLAMNFPAESEAWNELAMDEESRASVIAAGMDLGDPAELVGFSVLAEMEHVSKALGFARDIKRNLIERSLPLKDALDMARTLVELKAAGYRDDLLEREKEPRVKKVFERLLEMDKPNLDIVHGLMAKYGFLR